MLLFFHSLIIAQSSDPLYSNKEITLQVYNNSLNTDVLQNKLFDAFPNPFNPKTTINYSLVEEGNVSLVVYNLLGQKIQTLVDESKSKGKYSVRFDGRNLSSGTYIYVLKINNHYFAKRLNLIK